MSALDAIRPFHEELTAIRRDIHAHPEIGFEEHRTADLVAGKLAEWGIEVHRGIGGTGVVGVLRRGNGHASIGLRADMDALPMSEDNSFAHRSQNPGRMHACGHDGHTTMLLGAARHLAQSGRFNGTVHFIFQPAEEGLGGAEAMIRDGLFQKFPCNFVYGMHNRPGLPVGRFAIRPGAMMAGGGFFDITIAGRGSHGARPEGSIDPVLTACHVVTALQSIVARNVPPADTAVLSVTRVEGGDAYNVIPQTGAIRGTARTMKRETMDLLESAMKRVARGVAEGFGATAEVDFRFLFAPLVNDAAETDAMVQAAAAVVGAANVEANGPQVMASEDFSFMLEAVPGAYINIGNGDTVGSCQVHNPAYDFNDEALPYGAAMFAELVEHKLARAQAD
ncbi:MAG: amidohydrolase [Rhodospirillales bacterium]|nr:amidohydrolase [Rhodospirillales bacterium]